MTDETTTREGEGAPADKATLLTRKTFLAGTLAAGSAALFSSKTRAFAEEEGEPHDEPRRYDSYGFQMGFWVETEKCIDCGTCAHKCNRANETPENQAPRRKIVEATNSRGENVFVSISCMHCLDPSCMSVCPAGAISKRERDGAVVVDHQRCIGCKYCFEACPFSVPKYNDEGMYKCDFCIENGTYPNDGPACVQGCSHDALHFGKINEILEEHGDVIVPLTAITGPSMLLSR